MATLEELLKKADERKSKGAKKFKPQRHRAWDYMEQPQKSSSVESQTKKITSKRNEKLEEQEIRICDNTSESEKLVKTDQSYPITTDSIEKLRRIEGVQKRIMLKITSHIRSQNGIHNVVDIPISVLAKKINTDKGTTRTSIKRLQAKSILLKKEGSRGRGGYTRVVVPEAILKECFNLFQCPPELLNEVGIISTEYENNTTPKIKSLPAPWDNINVELLEEIGFSENHLKQLHSNSLNTPDIIQESINHFAYGLKHNADIKKYSNPVKVLMGVLRKGEAWIESKYQSPLEIAQREFLERKKEEKARLDKLEGDAYKLAFEEWQDELSQEEIDKHTQKKAGDITPKKVRLSLHFKNNVWPEKKQEYLVAGN